MRAFALSATKGREKEVERLFLLNQDLQQVPEEIRLMDNLQVLDLSHNTIAELPSWLGTLPKLHQLILDNNRGLLITDTVGLAASLEHLSLQSLAWASLPAQLFKLPRLRFLDLSDNQIDELTEGIPVNCPLQNLNLNHNRLGRLPKNFKHLIQLRKLSATNNELNRLPASLGNCYQLVDLQLSNNRLTALPKSIGRLEKLENLTVNANRLRTLPTEVATCRMLRKLELSDNRLKSLPPGLAQLEWLRELDLSGNKMRKCPTVVTSCRRLRKLSLSGNKMKRLLTWPKGASLEVLDCSKNQLASIEGLAELEHLEILNLSSNQIQSVQKGFWQFPRLLSLVADRNPVKLAGEDFLGCPALEHLQGLLPLAKRSQLLAFLVISRQEDWDEKDRKQFFELFSKKKETWEGISYPVAWRGVQVQDPYFSDAFRRFFYKRSSRKTQIKEGSKLLILGSLSKHSHGLYEKLSNLGVHWTTNQDADATHIIFGTNKLPPELPRLDLPWYTEEQLTRSVDRLSGKLWSQKIDEEQFKQIRKLLWNQQEVNVRLAIQLLRGSGVHKRIREDLLALYFRQRFPNLQGEIEAVLFPYLPDLTRTLLEMGQKPPASLDDLKSWKKWLGTKEIKAEVLISKLQ